MASLQKKSYLARDFLIALVCLAMANGFLYQTWSHLSRVRHLEYTSVAVLVAEQLRGFTDMLQLESQLSTLSSIHHLEAFLVTDSAIASPYKMEDFFIIKSIDVMTSVDVKAQSLYLGCETRGNMRQWYKLSRAFANMEKYESESGKMYTHVMRFRSDFIFANTYNNAPVLDAIPLQEDHKLFMYTDQVFFSRRDIFRKVLCTPDIIRKYWNTYNQYFPIDIRTLLAKSASEAGKLEWLCMPPVFFSNASASQKLELFDTLNSQIMNGFVKRTDVKCRWSGPPYPFSSERVFLLNALVQNITPHAAFRGKLVSDRHKDQTVVRGDAHIHNC